MASGPIVNIRRDVDDKFYRYKMPVLQTKIEGKGNGIKTVIPNMSDVARALSRPPTYSTKYFGCELGAQTSFDEKNDRYIVNGAHDANRLRELLDGFIDKFVLCGECKNPETDLFLTRNEEVYRDCKACGARTMVDMRHKLITFILRNPPKKPRSKKKPADGEDAKEGEEGDEEDGGSDDEFTKRIKAEAAELPTVEQLESAGVINGVGALTLEGDEGSDEGGDSPMMQLTLFIEERKSNEEKKLTPDELLEKINDLGLEKKHKTVQSVAETLFTEKVLTEVKTYTPVLQALVTSERHQKALLGGIERLVGIHYPDLVPTVPKILMELYQSDILEEEIITQWGTHVSKKYVDRDISKRVRKAAEPFLKWLEEADEDDDDDE
ncbi:hypothetical protein FRC03_008594 [Tulasnella sp. 419]|nr:hypothetical protein FRC02_010006 [Tulasnella sp. 418]KAG8970397.1 hypothetical protein FRC03_008594 [Tulasnella sp. 419]